MTETVAACVHDRTRPWLEIPFDVTSDRATAFGRVVRCLDCGHGMERQTPETDEISVHYDFDHCDTKSGSHMPQVTPQLADRIVTRQASPSPPPIENEAESRHDR